MKPVLSFEFLVLGDRRTESAERAGRGDGQRSSEFWVLSFELEADKKSGTVRGPKCSELRTPTFSLRPSAFGPRLARTSCLSRSRFTFHVLPFTVRGSDARTPLADFFSILLRMRGRGVEGKP